MAQDNVDRPNEQLSDTLRLEEILPEYAESVIYTKYMASDLLRRMEDGYKESEELIMDCVTKAVANNELQGVMPHVAEFIIGRQNSMALYRRLIARAEDALRTHNISYALETHPTVADTLSLAVSITGGSYAAQQACPAHLPASAGLSEERRNHVFTTTLGRWQELESVIRYASMKPSSN